jgi:hypothetical protein
MTALPPGRTIQELNRNPNSEQLLGLTEAQVGQSLQQLESRDRLNTGTAAVQEQADRLALEAKVRIIRDSELGAQAMATIARAVMPEAERAGVDPREIMADWIGKRR